MEQRDRWASKVGFILAAIGSAIGLGNIWRYPYVVYENGGGAFLIPYFIALLTAGIPILLMEYVIGHKYKSSAPLGFRKIHRGAEWIGWWQVIVAFFVATYYMVILGWALSYTYYSFGTQWGEDTEGFFFNHYLSLSEDFWGFGGFQWKVLLPFVIVWAVTFWIMHRGVSRGIEMANKILMPILIVMMIVITIRGVTLPGAAEGLNVLFTPDFDALANPKVWVQAYGHVFFSLSIAFAIMLTYASYLPEKTDLTNSGLIAGLANSGFEFMAAIGVFATLGFLAASQGVAVDEVATAGVGLAFVVFPQVINAFPFWNSLFGVLFFGSLLFAGFTSSISILEPVIAGMREKFGLSRKSAVNWVCGIAFSVGLIYTTSGGLRFLDVVDHFTNQYGIVLGGLLEVILIAWISKKLDEFREHANNISYVRLGSWWNVCLKWITPVLLTCMLLMTLLDEFSQPYEGYPHSGLIAFGWSVLGIVLIGALYFTKFRRERRNA